MPTKGVLPSLKKAIGICKKIKRGHVFPVTQVCVAKRELCLLKSKKAFGDLFMTVQTQSASKKQINMLEGPLIPSFISYALPLVLASLMQMLYNAADIAVLGNLSDGNAVASVGATTIIVNFVVNTFTSIATGGNILAARVFGAKDDVRIARLVRSTYTFSLILGVVIAGLGQLLTLPLLHLTDCPESVIEGAELYMRIYFLGVPASTFYNYMAGIMRSSGDSRRPFFYLAVSGAVNVILNVVLVLTTDSPVASVAIATVASMYVSAGMLFVHMVRTKGADRLRPFDFRMSADVMLKIIRLGIPAAISSVCFSFANIQIQSAVNAYLEAGITGNTAAIQIENAMFAVTNSATTTVSAFLGQSLGAGNNTRALQIIKKSYVFWFVAGAMATALLLPFSRGLLTLIAGDNQAAIDFGINRLMIMLSVAPLHALMTMNNGVLQASGKTTLQMAVNLIGICGFRTLWMNVFYPMHKTPFMLYIAYPISFALVFLVNMYFVSRMIKKLKSGEIFVI